MKGKAEGREKAQGPSNPPKLALLGDVGATKTILAQGWLEGERIKLQVPTVKRYVSANFPHLPALLQAFFQETQGPKPHLACLGVPGPVVKGQCRTTNLPWLVEARSLASQLSLDQVLLINDVAALAWAFSGKPGPKTSILHPGQRLPGFPLLVVAAGTGLGAAALVSSGTAYTVLATEAGHCDFAPTTSQDDALRDALAKEFGHVSYERVVSGPGLLGVYRFFSGGAVPKALLLAPDPPAQIVARAHQDAKAKEAVVFVARHFGTFVGNLALTYLPHAGIALAGSLALALLGKGAPPGSRQAFLAALHRKGRQQELVASFPLRLVTDPLAPLLGCGQALRGVL
ncbi:MAG: glucokinase [Thermoanaerobaculaceae bacterium]